MFNYIKSQLEKLSTERKTALISGFFIAAATYYFYKQITKPRKPIRKMLGQELDLKAHMNNEFFNENEGLSLKRHGLGWFMHESDIRQVETSKLVKLNDSAKSHHVIIVISGYLSEYQNDLEEWGALLQIYPNFSIYALKWRSSSWSKVSLENFIEIRKEAKRVGKLLAACLFKESKTPQLKDKVITLMGHSLGTEVIMSCIKYIFKMGREADYSTIQNVLLLGGAKFFDENKKRLWRERYQVVQGSIVNCYNKNDYVLKYLDSKKFSIPKLLTRYPDLKNIHPTGLIRVGYSTILDKKIIELNFTQEIVDNFGHGYKIDLKTILTRIGRYIYNIYIGSERFPMFTNPNHFSYSS